MTDRFGAAVASLVARLLERRKLALVGAAVVVGALALVGSRLQLDEDLSAFLPLDDPKVAEQLRALRAFRGLETLRVDLGLESQGTVGVGKPGVDEGPVASVGSATAAERDLLRVAARAFEQALAPDSPSARAPGVAALISRVSSGPSPEAGLALDELARRSLPSLVEPETVAAVLSQYESDAAVDDLLARHVLTLNQLEGPFLKDHVRRDPLGFESAFFEKLRTLGEGLGGAHLEDGRIVSADSRHVLVSIEPAVPSSRTDEAARVLDLIDTARDAASQAAGARVRAVVAGGHRAAVENARAIKRDAWVTSLVSLVAMLVVYAWVFPRRWLIPLTAVPLVAGGVVGAALSSLLLGKMSAIAVGFGGILLGLADDFIVLLYYCYETRSRELQQRLPTDQDHNADPRLEAVARVARPLVAAGAAIAAAFLALAVSGFPGQRDLAIFATTSLAGTLVFTLLIQPLLLPSGPSPRPLPDTAAPVRAFVRLVERHRALALGLSLVATVGLALAAGVFPRLRFDDDPRAIDGSSAATRAAEEELARDFGDQRGFVFAVARGPDLESALEQSEVVERRLQTLKSEGKLEGVVALGALVPSKKTQERRRAAWHALFGSEERAELAARFARLAPAHHFSARAFEPFFARMAGEGEPVNVPALLEGPLKDLLATRIATDSKGAFVLTLVRPKKAPDGSPDLSWASDLERETGALVGSRSGFARELVSVIHRRLLVCGALAFVVVLLILYPALGSLRRTGAAALALVVGLVWSLGLLALLGAAINAVNFLIPVLVLGLAVDYAIFLASGYGDAPEAEAAREGEAQGAVLASGITTLAGMASLLVAQHPAVFSVGFVALVGTAASLAAVFVIVPAVLHRRPRTERVLP